MDPADWELVVAANAKLNSKFSSVLGNLSNVPIGRRVAGPGASVVMAPFVHCSPNNPSRFSDGSYGIYYAGNSEQLALAETIHHHACFMLDDEAAPCWISGFQLVEGSVDSELHDVDAVPGARDPDDYRLSQQIGKALRNAGSEGLTWTSARLPGGSASAFSGPMSFPFPDLLQITVIIGMAREWILSRISTPARLSAVERSLNLLIWPYFATLLSNGLRLVCREHSKLYAAGSRHSMGSKV